MNVFARTVMTTLCVSAGAATATLEPPNAPGPRPNPAPTQAPDRGNLPQPPIDPKPAETAPGTVPAAVQPEPGREAAIHEGRYPRLNASDVDTAIARWDPRAKQAVRALITKYGEPNEMTSRRIYWYDTPPWLWTSVRNEPVMNNWPRQHAGVIEQGAALRVPLDRVGDMARFGGAMVIDRNEGVVTYRSDSEGWNFLAINLAYQIAGGTRDAESARREFERLSLSSGEPSPLMERFTFAPVAAGSGDPDREVRAPGSPGVTPSAATPIIPSPLPIERPRVPDDEKKPR